MPASSTITRALFLWNDNYEVPPDDFKRAVTLARGELSYETLLELQALAVGRDMAAAVTRDVEELSGRRYADGRRCASSERRSLSASKTSCGS